MKRVQVTEEELAILEGLRHERAIWNQALEAAATAAIKAWAFGRDSQDDIAKAILELRK